MSKLLYITAATTYSGIVYGTYKSKRENKDLYECVTAGAFEGLFWPYTLALFSGIKLGLLIEKNQDKLKF